MAKVEIDEGSGFCFGVVTAINKAEEELSKSGTLYRKTMRTNKSSYTERTDMQKSWDWWGKPQEKQLL